MRKHILRHFSTIWGHVILGYFIINLTTLCLMAFGIRLMIDLGVWTQFHITGWSFLIALFGVSLILGTLIAIFIFRFALRPIMDLSRAMQRVAEGDYSVRLERRRNGVGDLASLYHNFNYMTQELASTEMLHSDFISNVSHEFKTPLSAITGYATLLQDDTLTEEERNEYIDTIIQSSKELSRMTGSILELSRLENQSIITDRESFRVDEQIRQCILRLEPQWSAKNLIIEPELDSITWYGNQELTSHIWNNLLDNAIKFTPQGGEIVITAHTDDQSLIVTVQDSGMGMTPEVQKHIFDKFYQGDTSHATEGNGLGLALVQRILELSDGTITVRSTPGEGSSFIVTLPVSPGCEEDMS